MCQLLRQPLEQGPCPHKAYSLVEETHVLLISSVTLSKLLNLPVCRCYYLYNENINVTFYKPVMERRKVEYVDG